jgi:hypothetical protein
MSNWQQELQQARRLWQEAENMQDNGDPNAKAKFREAAELYNKCLNGSGYNFPAVQKELQERALYND